MLRRIREEPVSHTRIDWGRTPVWEPRIAGTVFGGDTLLAFAGFAGLAGPIEANTVRMLGTAADGRTAELARGEAVVPRPGATLAQVAAARQLHKAERQESVGLTYPLMSEHTVRDRLARGGLAAELSTDLATFAGCARAPRSSAGADLGVQPGRERKRGSAGAGALGEHARRWFGLRSAGSRWRLS